jgi:hypothetical protein
MAAMVVALAACATGTIETARTVPGDPAAVRARIEAELNRLGFRPVSGSPGTSLEATDATAAVDWAACTPVLVGGGDNGTRMTTAGQRRASVRVDLTPGNEGTSVVVAANFAASYHNAHRGYGFERACRSKGVVEARVLGAALGLSGPRTL